MSNKTMYFRNKKRMDTIDPDSLWKLEGEWLVLIDEDQHWTVFYEGHNDWFYPIEKPKELK